MENNRTRSYQSKVGAFMFILVTCVCVFCGCGRNSSNDSTQTDLVGHLFTISPEQIDLASYSSGAHIDTLIVNHATYSILSSTDNSVTLEITAPDMRAIFESLIDYDADISDVNAEYERIMTSVITALESRSSTVTNTVTVAIERVNGEPSLVPTWAFMDAMYGGMLSFYDELTESVGGES